MMAIAIFGFATITIAQVPSYVPTNGLISYWPFNGNANDLSGNGNNGTVYGATLTKDRFGNSNEAYSFNGTSNYIDCGPLSAIPNNVGDITQSAWVLAPNNQTAYCKMAIMSKRQLINQSWPTIGGGANGTVGFPVNNQAYFFLSAPNYLAGVTNAMSSTSLTNDSNWHLVTGTKKGSIYKLYFDGILQDSLTDNYSLSSNSNLIIGHEAMWGFECEKWFAGKLDDIGIWNRALTQQEITDLYNGCQLSVNTQPINQTINVNNNAKFVTGSSDPSATYQWQTDLGVGFQNLNSVVQYTGTTNDTLTVSNVTMSNNNQPFRCIVTSGPCYDTSNVAVLTVDNKVGIYENSKDNLFTVFPNPAQSVINVKADNKLIGEVYAIYDNIGRVVLSGKLNNQNTTIELWNLPGGLYLLSVGENTKKTIKLVKE